LLPRPDEEIQDQGLGFDLDTLVGRRRMLRAFGHGAVALGAAACGTGSSTGTSGSAPVLREVPDETAGPYPGDGSNGPNVLTASGIVRSDIRASFGGPSGTAVGVPMTLELTLIDIAGGNRPFGGVAVYVWHCDRDGNYSLYSDAARNENYLRGVQIADATGTVRYTSIFPACYAGRWPHIHVEVYPTQASITDAGKAIATSQVALPQRACDRVYAQTGYQQSVTNLAKVSLASDNVFGDDSAATQLATRHRRRGRRLRRVPAGRRGHDHHTEPGAPRRRPAGVRRPHQVVLVDRVVEHRGLRVAGHDHHTEHRLPDRACHAVGVRRVDVPAQDSGRVDADDVVAEPLRCNGRLVDPRQLGGASDLDPPAHSRLDRPRLVGGHVVDEERQHRAGPQVSVPARRSVVRAADVDRVVVVEPEPDRAELRFAVRADGRDPPEPLGPEVAAFGIAESHRCTVEAQPRFRSSHRPVSGCVVRSEWQRTG
jgi:protocatechuate 3,4-dioxygenase beta subunit